jgi:hypothetical protein
MAVNQEDPKKKDPIKFESRFGGKYTSQIAQGSQGFTSAVSDLANPEGAGMQVQFYHIATKRYAEFPAFITSFNDSFTSNWDPTEAIGRMDPIMNFRNTTRSMSLGLEVPAVSRAEAKSNLVEINRLIQFLYPTYTSNGSAKTMNGSPLVKVQFKNLISTAKNVKMGQTPLSNLQLDAKEQGLICAITSLSATPDFEGGTFGQDVEAQAAENIFGIEVPEVKPDGVGMQFPKLWTIELSFNVLHDHSLDSNFENAAGFPYGLGDRDEVNKNLVQPTPKYFDFTGKGEDEKQAGAKGSGRDEAENEINNAEINDILNQTGENAILAEKDDYISR